MHNAPEIEWIEYTRLGSGRFTMFNVDCLSKKNDPVEHGVFDWIILFGRHLAGGRNKTRARPGLTALLFGGAAAGLALGVGGGLARALETRLLAFLFARVAREQVGLAH